MANWSETIVELRGNKENIEKAKEVIEKYIDGDYFYIDKENVYKEFPEFKDYLDSLDDISFRAGFSIMEISRYETDETYIFIGGSGRWCSPSLFFKLLAQKYSLSMTYCDAEAGVGFCYFIEMEDGKVVKEEEKDYYCPELVKYLFGGDIYDFIETIDWYFEEGGEKIESIEKVLEAYGTSREEVMASL